MSSSEQQLETVEGRKSCANNNQPCTKATPSRFAGAKKIGEPEQQQHVLTILSKKQIKRAISWDDPNFLIVHATHTQAGSLEVSRYLCTMTPNSIWWLYLIILTSSIKTGAACSRCLEQTKNRQRGCPSVRLARRSACDARSTKTPDRRSWHTADALLASARGRRSFQTEPGAIRTFDRSDGCGQDQPRPMSLSPVTDNRLFAAI
jgi:hypothetical protein